MRTYIVGLVMLLALGTFSPFSVSAIETSTGTNANAGVCYVLTRPLFWGSTDRTTGGEVSKLQNFLASRPEAMFTLPGASASGIFGSLTRDALIRFQRAQNIFAAGIVGPVTRAKIKELSCGTVVGNQIKVFVGEQVYCITTPCNPVALSGARVTLYGAPNQTTTLTTDASGIIKFGNLAVGTTYTITVEKEGYQSVTRTATVTSAENLVDITLTRVPPQAKSVALSATPSMGAAPVAVTFNATLRNVNSCRSISMDFGDGTLFSAMPSCAPGSPDLLEQTFSTTHTYTVAGTYSVSLSANGTLSNTVVVTVGTTPVGQASIHVTAPNTPMTWPVGSTQTLSWETQNMPQGADVIFSASGPMTWTLHALQGATPAGSVSVQIPDSQIVGDVGMNIQAGSYKVRATMYDKMPCGGLCYPPVLATVLAQDESDQSVYITRASQMLGDLNGDGLITLADVELLAGHVAGTRLLGNTTPADVDANGRIDKADTYILRKVVLGILSSTDLPFRWGDLNLDGSVTIADVVLATRIADGLSVDITNKGRIAADVDMNGVVNRADASLVSGAALGVMTLPGIWGDLDGNYVVELVDAVLITRFVDGLQSPTAAQRFLADVYKDGNLNSQDVITLRQFVLGTIPSLPVTPPTN